MLLKNFRLTIKFSVDTGNMRLLVKIKTNPQIEELQKNKSIADAMLLLVGVTSYMNISEIYLRDVLNSK